MLVEIFKTMYVYIFLLHLIQSFWVNWNAWIQDSNQYELDLACCNLFIYFHSVNLIYTFWIKKKLYVKIINDILYGGVTGSNMEGVNVYIKKCKVHCWKRISQQSTE